MTRPASAVEIYFSDRLLAGMNRTNQWSGSQTAANSGAEVGMKGVFSTCVPVSNITDYGTWGIGGCSGGEADTNWKFQDNFHLLRGKHSLAFGASYYTWNANFPTDGISGGNFTFLPAETGLPGTAFANQTGVGYASFLLGTVDNANTLRPFEKGLRSKYFGVFVQDEYRVSPKLTLNAGLRWEYQPPYHELHDTATSFSPTIPNAAAGGLLGALEFLGTGPGRSGKPRFSDPYLKGFGPRVGFAYKLTTNTVLRGSYGLFWAPVSQWSGEFEFRAGFRPTLNVASSNAGATPAFNWDSGFPIGQFNINPVLDPTLGNGSGASWHDPSQAHPPAQVQIVNFSVQRELRGQMLLEVAYAGNLSHHIGTANLMEINQLDYAKYGSLGSLLLADINSPEAITAGYTAPFPGFEGSVGQSLRPYPQFLGINGGNPSIGNSLYHSVQFKLQKRFSNGLSFLVGETIAKGLTDTATSGNIGAGTAVFANGVQDAYNRRNEKAMDATMPFPSHLVISYAYELPLGPGKKFLNHRDVFSKYVVGGWTIGGIQSYASGGPLGFSTNIRLLTTGDSAAAGVPSTPVRPDFASGAKTTADIRSAVCCGGFDPATEPILLIRGACGPTNQYLREHGPQLQQRSKLRQI